MPKVEWQRWLANELRDEGLRVKERAGWDTRTQPTLNDYTPVGLLNHHTAPPVPFPLSNLETKCNLNIKPDGTVWVMSAGYAYDSGKGSSEVLDRVRQDLPPNGDARDWSRLNDTNGNPWFIDIEVDHAGDGSPIPTVQYNALIGCNVAILNHKQWSINRLIGHREWTDRKVDPRWVNPGPPFAMPVMDRIRADTFAGLHGDGNEGEFMIWREGDRGKMVKKMQHRLNRANTLYSLDTDGVFGPLTKAALEDWQNRVGIPVSGEFDGSSQAELVRWAGDGATWPR